MAQRSIALARNGSGTYTLPATMATANTVSNSATVNSIMSDVATALTDSINKDGTKSFAANQSMGNNKLTSLASGTATTDAANVGQVQAGRVNWADAGGTADAITGTYTPAPTSLTDGDVFFVRASAANATTTPTFTPNSGTLTARTIVKGANTALAVGDINGDGHELILRYRSSDTKYVLLNPYSAAISLTSTTEILTGTDTTKAATADAIAALWEQGSDVASAGTISLGEGGYFNITGTTTITDIDFATDKAGRKAWVKFAGALTLTHNASTLILPGGASITTAAGDTACFVSEGSDVVRCVSYNKASGLPVVSPASGGMTLLGTITTTSGTSQTLSGLTLTNYKFLRLVLKGVSHSTPQALLVGNSSGDAVQMTGALGTATNTFSGTIDIDLANGVFTSCVFENISTNMSRSNSTSPLTTSSTAIYVAVNTTGSFDAGSIIVYGVS